MKVTKSTDQRHELILNEGCSGEGDLERHHAHELSASKEVNFLAHGDQQGARFDFPQNQAKNPQDLVQDIVLINPRSAFTVQEKSKTRSSAESENAEGSAPYRSLNASATVVEIAKDSCSTSLTFTEAGPDGDSK